MSDFGDSPGKGEYTVEDELRIFEAGVKSEFWQFLVHRKRLQVKGAIDKCLSEVCDNRELWVGRKLGHEDFLEYPQRHVNNLRTALKRQQDEKLKATATP